MQNLILPNGYRPLLDEISTEKAIRKIKDQFQNNLSFELNLQRVTAPLFVLSGMGINDDLNGIEKPVSFNIRSCNGKQAEIVHSLAKWKRMKLAQLHSTPGTGIYTDMNAIRADEDLDNLHSLYVDQWDWEKAITAEDRNLNYLKNAVEQIYYAVRRTEASICSDYPQINPFLPEKITFVHTEDLEKEYPQLNAKEREDAVSKKFGAVFIIGIGGDLPISGKPHDGRAPDYDDWSTPCDETHKGLNGDIVIYNSLLERSYEISSMGIRVDQAALELQLSLRHQEQRKELAFHKALLHGDLPLCIGGGIGQSRLCMLLLHKAHIGEIQSSIWPEEMRQICAAHNIPLL